MFKFWCITGVRELGVGKWRGEEAPGGKDESVENVVSKQIF